MYYNITVIRNTNYKLGMHMCDFMHNTNSSESKTHSLWIKLSQLPVVNRTKATQGLTNAQHFNAKCNFQSFYSVDLY